MKFSNVNDSEESHGFSVEELSKKIMRFLTKRDTNAIKQNP